MNLYKHALPVAALSLVLAVAAVAHWSNTETRTAGQSLFASESNPAATDLTTRVKTLEQTLSETLKIQHQLLELVNELSRRLEPDPEHGEIRNAALDMAGERNEIDRHRSRTQATSQHENRFTRMRENQIRQLTDAGFSPERAAAIIDQQERIQHEQMQFTYEYHHLEDKQSDRGKALQEKIHTYSNPQRVFEQELSQEEFDLYLKAFGGRTEMEIGDLLESTPAYEAGLRPGDKIIRYNNQRVFHMGDLRSQVYQVAPGTSVPVEIQRRGSSGSETIYLPAGPLGIRG
ncbi:PDZ domain-containing protein [Microbulbifer bruguierae]|uniref:PDZ domain-containing protein n=1 Tax=Microbulbifer bruguierae TaxID=3029061 RepID=A0ABY8ND22_9GAMM|nr:PDZ domain-containing protein [Microbulbifer bruguierae]WGL16693.1 PDZ domain-containing protein [Microbulbifer bruguierae]